MLALFTFNDESLGLLAFHNISFIVACLIRFMFRLKTSANFNANSYLLTLVAPAVCRVPMILLSATSKSISARFVFNVGETYCSVRIFTSFPWLRLFINQVAKLSFWFRPQQYITLARVTHHSWLCFLMNSSPFSFVWP